MTKNFSRSNIIKIVFHTVFAYFVIYVYVGINVFVLGVYVKHILRFDVCATEKVQITISSVTKCNMAGCY